jgi:4-amino-4-deoxy-L-arabinose transferase-like glycosyltransferase
MSSIAHPTRVMILSSAGWRLALWTLAILVLALLLLITPQSTAMLLLWPRWLAIMALAWWLPGVLLALHWRLPDLDWLAFWVLAAGLGWCWMILLLLILHWLPGPLTIGTFVALYIGGAMVLLLTLNRRNGEQIATTPRLVWGGLAFLLGLALLLRLPGLGYHEFHYDEVLVLTRAREAIRGADDAFARHTKGPGELAVATVVYRALNTANETTARLPFALVSVASVIALAVLGARLFSWRVGWLAGLLLTVNGFALGLSRIVQYQPAMLLLSILAVLATWEFARQGRVRWLALALVFASFGLVMHYEFILMTPILGVLAGTGWRRSNERLAVFWTLAAVGGGGATLVAAAYLPIYLNAYYAGTQGYLSTRLGDAGAWNLPFFIEMGAFYNSIYFFAGMIGLVIAGLVWGWRHRRWQTLLLILWFSPYFVLYLLIVQFPGTHFYLFMPSWSLLAALPLVALWSAGGLRSIVRWAATGLVMLWLGLALHYLYIMFFRQAPEYLINYQTARIPLYWAPYGQNIPEKPRFGFPIQEGWKTLGVLAEWKYLGHTYASNEYSRHLRWYLGAFERVEFTERPDFIFVARHVQEPDPDYDETRLADYQRVGEVRVRGEPRIELWARQPLAVDFVTYDAESFAPLFDGIVPTLYDFPAPAPRITDQPLDDRITLVAASVDQTHLRPGDLLHIRLDWLPTQPLRHDYKLFVHLADATGRPLAQWDGLPGLNTARTSQWAVGETFTDHVILPIPPDIASGKYELLVGLYDPVGGARVGGRAIAVAVISL